MHKQGLPVVRDETDVSWVWTNVFFFFGGEGLLGLTAGDGCPKSQQCIDGRQRLREILNEGGVRRKVVRSRCDPHLLPVPK